MSITNHVNLAVAACTLLLPRSVPLGRWGSGCLQTSLTIRSITNKR